MRLSIVGVVAGLVLLASPSSSANGGGEETAAAVGQSTWFDPRDYVEYAREHEGDPDRGQRLFEDQQRAACCRCHAVQGEGGTIGPDLSDVGAKLDRAHLIESVLEPSAQLVEGYRPTVVALTDGRVLTGVVAGASRPTPALVDAEGREHRRARRRPGRGAGRSATSRSCPTTWSRRSPARSSPT